MRRLPRQLAGAAALAMVVVAGARAASAQEASPRAATGQLPVVGDHEIFQPGTQPCSVPDVASSCFHTAHTDEYDRKFHPAQADLLVTRSGEAPIATDGASAPKLEAPCGSCHGGTMMAQAWRDPVARAAIAVANADLTRAKIDYSTGQYDDGPRGQTGRSAGDLCIRCHSPVGWLEGDSIPADGSRIHGKQMDGVQCDFCHRALDPLTHEYERPRTYAFVSGLPGSLLEPDAAGGQRVPAIHNGNFVVNDTGRKIGPYLDPLDLGQHPLDAPASTAPNPLNPRFASAAAENAHFLSSAKFCAQCHNVTNPILRVPEGFPGAGKSAPVERTYTEWYFSAFGPAVKGDPDDPLDPADSATPCQSCHMERVAGGGTAADPSLADPGVMPLRDPLRRHTFVGGNAWAPALIPLFFPDQLPLQAAGVFDAVREKARANLRAAARLEATLADTAGGKDLAVRVVNETGHKLPTGYPEGRRMWLHVVARDAAGAVVYESGRYEDSDATLVDDPDLKVWRAVLGIKKPGADPVESPRFILNNVVLQDNRIAPLGFDPVKAAADVTIIRRAERDCRGYDSLPESACAAFDFDGDGGSDGYDIVHYPLPAAAVSAEVTLRYQTASKEYVEFLSDPSNAGEYADRFTAGLRAAWTATGMSAPVDMASTTASAP
jgi:hypothetical protein